MNNLELSDEYKPVLEKVKQFIKDEIEPVESEYNQEIGSTGDRWQHTDKMIEILGGLKAKAKEKKLVKLGGNYDVIANSRIEIETARLLTLKTARLMDLKGNKAARGAISQIKVYVPQVALQIIDRAIQLHGGTGVSQWTPLAGMWSSTRVLQIVDGPDAVHRMVVAREEIRKYQ